MTTLHTVLYSIALFSQVVVISILLPRTVVDTAIEGLEIGRPVRAGRRFTTYLSVNRFTALLGFGPLVLAWLSGFEESLTLVLLATGVFFFVQLAALVSNPDVRNPFTGAVAVSRQVSRALVSGAVAVYVAYVVVSLVYQNGPGASTWAKIQIVTLANAFFVAILLPGWVNLRRASADEQDELSHQAARSVNVLATVSIGLSVYFFGKDVLFALDVSTLRPMVMSLFLQGLALAVVPSGLGRRTIRRPLASTSIDDR